MIFKIKDYKEETWKKLIDKSTKDWLISFECVSLEHFFRNFFDVINLENEYLIFSQFINWEKKENLISLVKNILPEKEEAEEVAFIIFSARVFIPFVAENLQLMILKKEGYFAGNKSTWELMIYEDSLNRQKKKFDRYLTELISGYLQKEDVKIILTSSHLDLLLREKDGQFYSKIVIQRNKKQIN